MKGKTWADKLTHAVKRAVIWSVPSYLANVSNNKRGLPAQTPHKLRSKPAAMAEELQPRQLQRTQALLMEQRLGSQGLEVSHSKPQQTNSPRQSGSHKARGMKTAGAAQKRRDTLLGMVATSPATCSAMEAQLGPQSGTSNCADFSKNF